MEKEISFKELDNIVIKVLKGYLQYDNPSDLLGIDRPDPSHMSFSDIESRAYRAAFADQNTNTSHPFSRKGFDEAGSTRIRQLLWLLIIQGKLVPGSDAENPGLPWLSFTEEGKNWLIGDEEAENNHFFTYAQYFSRLDSHGVVLGSIAKGYVAEAVHCYFNNCPKASMVMIGVAMEALFDEIDQSLRNCNLDDWKDIKLAKQDAPYSKRLKQFHNAIQPHMKEIADIVDVENPLYFLTALLEHTRQMRNDGAHPALKNHDSNEAFAMLELFMRIAQILCRFRDYLND